MKFLISSIVVLLAINAVSSFELTSDWILENKPWYYFDNSTSTTNGSTILHMYLSMKNITSINVNAFKPWASIIDSITLMNNKIVTIDPAVFEGMTRLNALDLTGNLITDINLPYLPNLERLEIQGTQLASFNLKISSLFPKLRVLRLGFNKIKQILPDAFFNANNLAEINLSGNGFTTLDVKLFQRLPIMYALNLRSNLFTRLDTEFYYLPSFRFLDVSYCQINYVAPDIFSRLPKFASVDLTGNKLTSLDPYVFQYPQMELIEISYNQLTTLDPEIFSGLTTVRTINIGYNNIASLPENIFSTNTALSLVNLQFNKLSTIPRNLFSNNKAITHIHISGNLMTSIDYNVFNGLSKLIYLFAKSLKFTLDVEAVKKAAGLTNLSVFF